MQLEVKNLNAGYGDLTILRDVDISVENGELVSIVGSNGTGKSTLLKCIIGLIKPRSGRIVYNGKDITRLSVNERVKLGIVYIPEGRRLFPYLTTMENLELGAYRKVAREKFKENYEHVCQHFPRLKERANQQALTLSGGEQQMLTIGRGLMASPELMLLDEPSLGLAPVLMKEIFGVIADLHKEGLTMILVEQNAKKALDLCNRAYVLENGRIAFQGKSGDLACDDRVRKAYLGL